MLADDDYDEAELFNEALAGSNVSVDFHHVPNGQSIFQFLGSTLQRKPDIIFLDINMPEMNGWQCLTKLKSHDDYKPIPVIVYSTSSYSRDKEMAKELGALGFLPKPTEFNFLVKALTRIANTTTSIDLKKVLQEITIH